MVRSERSALIVRNAGPEPDRRLTDLLVGELIGDSDQIPRAEMDAYFEHPGPATTILTTPAIGA
jgi:hypothetical protein